MAALGQHIRCPPQELPSSQASLCTYRHFVAAKVFIPLLFPKDTSSYTMATGNVGTKIWNPRASVMTVSNSAQLGMFLQVRDPP